eukprot:g17559.t1
MDAVTVRVRVERWSENFLFCTGAVQDFGADVDGIQRGELVLVYVEEEAVRRLLQKPGAVPGAAVGAACGGLRVEDNADRGTTLLSALKKKNAQPGDKEPGDHLHLGVEGEEVVRRLEIPSPAAPPAPRTDGTAGESGTGGAAVLFPRVDILLNPSATVECHYERVLPLLGPPAPNPFDDRAFADFEAIVASTEAAARLPGHVFAGSDDVLVVGRSRSLVFLAQRLAHTLAKFGGRKRVCVLAGRGTPLATGCSPSTGIASHREGDLSTTDAEDGTEADRGGGRDAAPGGAGGKIDVLVVERDDHDEGPEAGARCRGAGLSEAVLAQLRLRRFGAVFYCGGPYGSDRGGGGGQEDHDPVLLRQLFAALAQGGERAPAPVFVVLTRTFELQPEECRYLLAKNATVVFHRPFAFLEKKQILALAHDAMLEIALHCGAACVGETASEASDVFGEKTDHLSTTSSRMFLGQFSFAGNSDNRAWRVGRLADEHS